MPAQQIGQEVDRRPRTLLECLREYLRKSIGLGIDDALQPQAGGRGGTAINVASRSSLSARRKASTGTVHCSMARWTEALNSAALFG